MGTGAEGLPGPQGRGRHGLLARIFRGRQPKGTDQNWLLLGARGPDQEGRWAPAACSPSPGPLWTSQGREGQNKQLLDKGCFCDENQGLNTGPGCQGKGQTRPRQLCKPLCMAGGVRAELTLKKNVGFDTYT